MHSNDTFYYKRKFKRKYLYFILDSLGISDFVSFIIVTKSWFYPVGIDFQSKPHAYIAMLKITLKCQDYLTGIRYEHAKHRLTTDTSHLIC